MRLRKADFGARVNSSLAIEFREERLTSYAGLELMRRYVRALGLRSWLERAAARIAAGGDVRFASLVLLIVGMLLVGCRRLRHVEFVKDDPLLRRFAGLARVPNRSTLGRFLKRFNGRRVAELDALNMEIVSRSLARAPFGRLTLDVDGSVLSTGMQVERAFRGYNPHHRKNPSYYPITAVVAQTGHVVGHRNRSGNVHDSTGAARFIERTVREVKSRAWCPAVLEIRTDGAFFQRKILETYDRWKLEYATKVPMSPWLGLKVRIAAEAPKVWECVDRANQVEGFFMSLPVPQWRRTEKVGVYRKRVNHKSRKSVQLDLFNPDDGKWEYSVIATNKTLGLAALWHFANGRGVQEKTFAELKGGYAFASIATNHYGANTAWQKLNLVAHNLLTSFQLQTTAEARARSRKRTAAFRLVSVRTARFEWLNKAARLLRPAGRQILRLAKNAATEALYACIQRTLPRAA